MFVDMLFVEKSLFEYGQVNQALCAELRRRIRVNKL